MTFLEAAIEILRQAEGPLRVSEITERAVQQKLLSHVGRDPETTMRNSLSSALRSNAHNGLLERLRPGSYQLRAGVSVPDVVVVAAQEQRQRTEGGESAPVNQSEDLRTRPVRRPNSERSGVDLAENEHVEGESPPKKGSRSKMRDDQESKTTRPEGDNLSSPSAGAN